MPVTDFINNAVSQYESISWFDSLRSCMLIYFLIAFFILYVGMMIALLSGIKGWKWILLFSLIVFFAGWSWVKLYQYYQLKTPVKIKVFNYRLARAVGMMNLKPELFIGKKGTISSEVETIGENYGIDIRYTQNLWRNLGGIIPGTPVQILRKIHPRTWFLEIRGKNILSTDRPVLYEFSARKDDDDSEDGYGIHLYDGKTFKKINAESDEHKKIIQRIKKAIDGTILKGSLTTGTHGFSLKIFDNLETIRRWRKPTILYKNYKKGKRLDNAGAAPDQAAFYGIDNLLRTFQE